MERKLYDTVRFPSKLKFSLFMFSLCTDRKFQSLSQCSVLYCERITEAAVAVRIALKLLDLAKHWVTTASYPASL